MLKLIGMLQRSEGAAQFSTSYVHRTAYSVMVDEMRRGQWQREVPLESDAPNLEPAVADDNPERGIVAAEIARGIHECLARLVEPRRLAVTLHLQGYSVPEAAEALAWERKRTENLIYRGLADLRQCLAAKGMTP
jgi:RNA polymerase sigma-70 factor (ECF subfamily)